MRALEPHAAHAAPADVTVPAARAGYTLALLPSSEWEGAPFRARWRELLARSGNVNAIYASPEWFDHLRQLTPERDLLLAAARDPEGELVGVVPVRVERDEMVYDVASRPLLKVGLRVANLLGSEPLLPVDDRLYERLCELLLDPRTGCDCVYLDTLPLESPVREFAARTRRRDLLTYFPYGRRAWHLVRLPATEKEYFAQLTGKLRYELKRRTKRLDEHCGGGLELVRVEEPGQAAAFVADAARVSRNSWQHQTIGTRLADTDEQRRRFSSLAERGLLRSYLLRCGEHPCAFVVGYQHADVFHYVEIGYDRDFAQLSPGMVLYHLLVRDLLSHRAPSLLNFGRGDADYKQRFANFTREDISVYVMRRTLRNRLLAASHASFRSLVTAAREVVRRRRAARAPKPDPPEA